MKTKLVALLLALFLLAPAVASADVLFELKNTSDFTRIVVLLWVDHPHKTAKGYPFPIAGAVLEPGKSFKLSDAFPPGVYQAEWRTKTGEYPDKVHIVHIGERSKKVRITPNGVKLLEVNKIKKGIEI
jgi:hypothetical protein